MAVSGDICQSGPGEIMLLAASASWPEMLPKPDYGQVSMLRDNEFSCPNVNSTKVEKPWPRNRSQIKGSL